MSLTEDIFPTNPRDGLIAQTEYVGSWESQLRGLGRHTAFLARYLLSFSAAVDDIAVDVVFLQRHRVEVGLKLILERTGSPIPASHDLGDLAKRCHAALVAAGRSELDAELFAEINEFVRLMHASDSGSFAYRYPVDTKNRPATRHQYVDLKELEKAGAGFQEAVLDTVNMLTRDESVPVSDAEIEPTAEEAEALIRAIRSSNAFWTQTYREIVDNRDKLAALTERPVGDETPQKAAADAYFELFAALEPPLLLLLRRLEDRGRASSPASAIEPQPITPLPKLTPGPPQAVRAQLDALLKAYVDGLAPQMLELKRTLLLLKDRTSNWEGPADRQLHADLGRFASRLMTGVDPHAVSASPSS